MQEITHNIALNLSQPNNFEYIHIMQGDYNAEKVIATLFDGNKLYTIDAQKASLQGSTSDGGLILQDDLEISTNKHQVTFDITKEMSSCSGELTCNIVFSSDNQKKSTFPFIIKNTADITGRTPVSVLTTISDYVDRAEKAASDAEKTLKDKADKVHKHTKSDITDFPTLGTASSKDVATSGNASVSQVVMGNDTRLSDARKASDVHDWAKAENKPIYTASEVGAYTKEETDTKLNDKANSSHTHGNGDITSLDAGKITSGTIDIDRLPQGALDRLVKVADDTERFKLTTNDIQLGDTVQTLDNKKMYYVVDESKLSSADGYATYTADTATSVPWSGITGKPSTYTPSNHTHTKSQITDFPTSMPASDVPAWAKASTKPSYTKSEVGLGNVDDTADSEKSVKYATSAGSASSASKATGVVDYGSTGKTIQIGYGGDGISGDAIKYIAGYTTGDGSSVNAKIKDISKDNLKSWLGLGSLAYSSATIPTSLPANGGNSSTVNGHSVYSDVPANAKFTDTNTDTKVTQTAIKESDYMNWRPLLWGSSNSETEGFAPTTVTDSIFTSTGLSVQPGTGTVRATNFKGNATSATKATKADYITGFLKANSDQTWGNQTGTFIAGMDDSSGGSIAFRRDNPSDGKLSVIIDGNFYQNEGQFSCLDTNNYSSYALPLSGGAVNGAVTFGKNDSYGIFTSTDNYCSIGSSSAYFYRSYIKNMYANCFTINNHLSIRPSVTSTTDPEYTDVHNSVWIHGIDSSDYYGTKKPGLLLRQGTNFFQVFPVNNSSSSATDIGHSSYRFRNIVGRTLYSDSGTVSTSDRNLKHDITNLSDEIVEKIVDGLIPKSFKFNDGDSGRTHYGIIAQELEELLISIGIDPNDFAPLVKVWEDKLVKTERNIIGKDGNPQTIIETTIEKDTDKEPTYHIRYEEFIMILVQYCQNLKKKNTDLEDKYNELTSTVNEILKKLN